MTKKEEIIQLNSTVKTRLAPSKIHGVGVHAIMDIKKGQQCYCKPNREMARWYDLSWSDLNKLFPEIKELIIGQWPIVYNGEPFLSPNFTCWPIAFINHSEDPNYDPDTDTALKDIHKGEELTEDYRKVRNWRTIFPWIKGASDSF